jgi:hypothetical protein
VRQAEHAANRLSPRDEPASGRKPILDMRRREFITLLGGAAAAWPLAARAQEVGRIYRLGFLLPATRQAPAAEALFDELRLNGFVEGKTSLSFRVASNRSTIMSRSARRLWSVRRPMRSSPVLRSPCGHFRP